MASGRPPLLSVSFFLRSAALCRRLRKFSQFFDGGYPFLEQIPSPPVPIVVGKIRSRNMDKKTAKRAHRKLVRKLHPILDGVVYTDGSAVPNPGRIGLGLSITFNNRTRVLGEQIDVCSILTAGLTTNGASVFYALPPKWGGGHWFSTIANHHPVANEGGRAPPFWRRKTEMGGGGKKYKNPRKRALLTHFARSFL